MEGSEVVGLTLNEIQKKPEQVKLVFQDPNEQTTYELTFDGLLFETSRTTLNHTVKDIRFEPIVGYRASSQLRSLKKKPEDYRQLFIQMSDSTDENKRELLGVYKTYKISHSKHSGKNGQTKRG
jgi:hypothetical protein